ncbi:hypothetical protein C8R44DRAFT_733068 [Mycena epipterygia]|nr:hypothetical protein C8R44DRAFT_733068 [Mycena epipterygia]
MAHRWQCIGLTTSDSDSQTLPLRLQWLSVLPIPILSRSLLGPGPRGEALRVQFVPKADAERAIEKIQSRPKPLHRQRRPRRSKPPPPPVAAPVPVIVPQQPAPANRSGNGIMPAMLNGMPQEQAIMLLQKFGMQSAAYAAPALGWGLLSQERGGGGVWARVRQQQGVDRAVSGRLGHHLPWFAHSLCHRLIPACTASERSARPSPAPANGGSYVQPPNVPQGTSGSRNAPQPQFTCTESLAVTKGLLATRSLLALLAYPNYAGQQQGGGWVGLYSAAELLGKRRDSYSAVPLAAGLGARAAAPERQRTRAGRWRWGWTRRCTSTTSRTRRRARGGLRDRDREEFAAMRDLNGTWRVCQIWTAGRWVLGTRPGASIPGSTGSTSSAVSDDDGADAVALDFACRVFAAGDGWMDGSGLIIVARSRSSRRRHSHQRDGGWGRRRAIPAGGRRQLFLHMALSRRIHRARPRQSPHVLPHSYVLNRIQFLSTPAGLTV